MSRPTVMLDLATDNRLAKDLVAGGVFVPGCKLELDQDCELIVRALEDEVRVAARVVFVDPDRGVGLELVQCSTDTKRKIAVLALTVGIQAPTMTGEALAVAAAAAHENSVETQAESDDAEAHATEQADADEDIEAVRNIPQTVHERMRGLSLAQQVKIAQHGEMHERIILERMYGKHVWEALLRNPKLTGQEVARISRMGALPRTLIEVIVGNGTWLQVPEVRRALLANHRLSPDQILRVLRLLPKHELNLAAKQTAYSLAVRDAARRLIRGA